MTPAEQAAAVRAILARRAQFEGKHERPTALPAEYPPGKHPLHRAGVHGPIPTQEIAANASAASLAMAPKYQPEAKVDPEDFIRPASRAGRTTQSGHPQISFTPRKATEKTPLEAQPLGRGMVKDYPHVGVASSKERSTEAHRNVIDELRQAIQHETRGRLGSAKEGFFGPGNIEGLRSKLEAEEPQMATPEEEGSISPDVPNPEEVAGPSEAGVNTYLKKAKAKGIPDTQLEKIRQFIAQNPRIMRMHIGDVNEAMAGNPNAKGLLMPKVRGREENVPIMPEATPKDEILEGSPEAASMEASGRNPDVLKENPELASAAIPHPYLSDEETARKHIPVRPTISKPNPLATYKINLTPSAVREQELLKSAGPMGREKKAEFLKEAKTRLKVRKYASDKPPRVDAAKAEMPGMGPPEEPSVMALGAPPEGLPVKLGPHLPAERAMRPGRHASVLEPRPGAGFKASPPPPDKAEKKKITDKAEKIKEALKKQRSYLYRLEQAEGKRKGEKVVGSKPEPRKGGEFARLVPGVGRFPRVG
jgi:hypothetical protein